MPAQWALTTLGEVNSDRSESHNPLKNPDDTFELYSVPAFPNGKPEYVKGRDIGSNKQTVQEGAVLLCGINPRINRVWIVGKSSQCRQIASTEWIPFFPLDGLRPSYLAYYLSTNTLRDHLAGNASGVGGSLMRVKASTLVDFPFPLPPPLEQHRIVAKIEELFSDLDAGVDTLKKTQALLKRYRQSVLKAAFSGKLTAKWRKANKGKLEPAAVLLERIRAERQKAGGTAKELPPVNTTDLPELPEGWTWVRARDISHFITKGTTPRSDKLSAGPSRRLPMPNTTKRRRLFDPTTTEPFQVSRSGIQEWMSCPRCYWLHRRLGVKPPGMPSMTINRAVDALMKAEFLEFRFRQEPHPAFLKRGIHAVPLDHPDIAVWQSNFKGVKFLHGATNLLVSGAPDDVLVVDGEWAVLDFKGTSSKEEIVALDTVFRQANARQVEVYSWLLAMNGHPVGRKAYVLFANAKTNRRSFDGRLDFDLQLVEHIVNTGWIEPTLVNIRATLMGAEPPPAATDCEACGFVASVNEAIA